MRLEGRQPDTRCDHWYDRRELGQLGVMLDRKTRRVGFARNRASLDLLHTREISIGTQRIIDGKCGDRVLLLKRRGTER
jgi:hypothetical protein